jgi:predicted DNA-binding transcriptional regulator AlpA
MATNPRRFDDIRLISFAEACEALNISSWTLDRWIRRGLFPAPIHLTPTSPRQFRVRDIAAHIDKRRRGRRVKQQPRGAVRQRLAQRARG